MSITNVQAAVGAVRNKGFVSKKDIDTITAAAGRRLGRQERATISIFMQDVVQNNGGLEAMPSVGAAARTWLTTNPLPQLAKPGDMQAQIMAGTMETTGRAMKAQGTALAWGAVAGLASGALAYGATTAGITALGTAWSGPFAIPAAAAGFIVGVGVGLWVGSRVRAVVQISQATSMFNQMQGSNSSDPDDLE